LKVNKNILGKFFRHCYFDNKYNGIRKIDYNVSCSSAAEELIRAGADLTAVNNEGKTPMDNKYVQKLREQKPELFQVIPV
jgi:hypothetical protein